MMSQQIEKIRRNVISCKKCNLCKTRTNAVPGKGSFKAEVVFVGEAPGRNEDQKGEPFVGSAGKKLDAALERVGISRESIYITNVVKCRPPKNRLPTKFEREMCRDYLSKELEIINPKIICVLGNTAFASLLGGKDITKNRGKIIKKDGRLYFVTIHPAAIIYNKKLGKYFDQDLKSILKLLSKIKSGMH